MWLYTLMLWLTVARKKNQKINNSKYTKIIFKSNIVVILFVFLSYRILSLMVLSRQSLIKITVGVFSKIDVVVVHTTHDNFWEITSPLKSIDDWKWIQNFFLVFSPVIVSFPPSPYISMTKACRSTTLSSVETWLSSPYGRRR